MKIKIVRYSFFFGILTGFFLLLGFKSVRAADQVYYLHTDQVGSVIAVTDAGGQVVSEKSYQAYGSDKQTVGNNSGERSYTGQIKDTTNLYYYNARYYDPVLSRFISADSVQAGNRYAYVGGNPISLGDPSGNMMDAGDGGGGGGREKREKTPNFGQINPYSYSQTVASPSVSANGVSGGTTRSVPSAAGIGYFGSGGHYDPAKDPSGLYLAAGASGVGCAFGFVPACVGVNVFLGTALAQTVLTGGADRSLTGPALTGGIIAGGGQALGVRSILESRREAIIFGRENIGQQSMVHDIDQISSENGPYYQTVKTISDDIRTSGIKLEPGEELSGAVSARVGEAIEYNLGYLESSMDTACRLGYGVCYHKSMLSAAVLDDLGFTASKVSIYPPGGGGHAFVSYIGESWAAFDPTVGVMKIGNIGMYARDFYNSFDLNFSFDIFKPY